MPFSRSRYSSEQARRAWAAVVILIGLGIAVPLPVDAKRRPRTVVVLPVIAEGDTPGSILNAVDDSVESVALKYRRAQLIGGDMFAGRLGGDLRGATERCDDDIRCLTRLGRKAGAGTVISGRATPYSGGARVRFFVIDVSSRTIHRTSLFDFPTSGDVQSALRDRMDELLGFAAPAAAVVTSSDDLAVAPALAMPGLTQVTGHDGGTNEGTRTVAATSVEPTTGATAPAVNAGRALGAIPSGPRVLRWVSFASLGLGAALLGTSGYYGLQYRSASSAIDADGPRTTSQPSAVSLETKANNARGRAGWLLLAGGLTAVAGGVLFIVDLQSGGDDEPRVALSVAGPRVALVAIW